MTFLYLEPNLLLNFLREFSRSFSLIEFLPSFHFHFTTLSSLISSMRSAKSFCVDCKKRSRANWIASEMRIMHEMVKWNFFLNLIKIRLGKNEDTTCVVFFVCFMEIHLRSRINLWENVGKNNDAIIRKGSQKSRKSKWHVFELIKLLQVKGSVSLTQCHCLLWGWNSCPLRTRQQITISFFLWCWTFITFNKTFCLKRKKWINWIVCENCRNFICRIKFQ